MRNRQTDLIIYPFALTWRGRASGSHCSLPSKNANSSVRFMERVKWMYKKNNLVTAQNKHS